MSGMRGAGLILAGVLVAVSGGMVAGSASSALAAATGKRVALPDPVPTWTQYYTDDGPAGAGVTVPIRIWLAGRAPAAEASFVTTASTPGNPAYGKYLTPAQFAGRFGATPAQVAAVEAWARSAGLTVTSATAHYVSVTGTAPRLSSALDTSIHAYSSSAATGYAPVTGISVPAAIGADVTTVTGLDGYSFGASSSTASSP
jgi:subtilase family serine protease